MKMLMKKTFLLCALLAGVAVINQSCVAPGHCELAYYEPVWAPPPPVVIVPAPIVVYPGYRYYPPPRGHFHGHAHRHWR